MNTKLWLKSFGYLIAVAAVGTLFIQCIFFQSSTEPNGAGGLTLVSSHSYVTIGGNKIIDTIVDTSYGCQGSLLQVYKDTSIDSQSYDLQGNTLSYLRDESLFTYDPITMSYSASAHAVVQFKQGFTRVGSGSGLQGRWKFTEYSYSVLSGALTSADSGYVTLSDEAGIIKGFLYYGTLELQFTATDILGYYDYQSAKSFLDDWNGTPYGQAPDSLKAIGALYNIYVVKVDQYTVRLTGNVTHEVVTEYEGNDGTSITTSNNPQHKVHRYNRNGNYDIPKCPYTADTSGDWIDPFYTDNLKQGVTAKAAVLSKSSASSLKTNAFWKRNSNPFLLRHPRSLP